ncbi:MAG: MG2 domain-containing protein [Myxococcota bacterium]
MPSSNAPHGDGPYREAPLSRPPQPTPRWLYVLLASPLALGLLLLAFRQSEEVLPELEDVPGVLLDAVAVFPPPSEELPLATPLDPLLAADQPELLTIMEPGPGALRLQRNQPIHVRFNRPMVENAEVGKPLDEIPLVFDPPIRGTAQWATRSRLIFHADDRAWNTNRESSLKVAATLRSLDGSTVFDEHERVVVFDGTPHIVSMSTPMVSPGDSLPLYFDNPVTVAELGRDVMAYEIGGGSRSVPFSLVSRGQVEQRFRIDVRPLRRLEEGASIGVAIAPRWTSWGGGSPSITRFNIQPPPQLTGVGCGETAGRHGGGCRYGTTPGTIVDIGPELRLLGSEALSPVAANQVRIVPALPEMSVRLVPPENRVLEIKGEWSPDQVYEVRLSGLRTAGGRPLLRTSPLAVRSAGHAPQVTVDTGRFAWELDADTDIHFRGIHLGKGSVLTRPVAPGDELRAILDPTAYAGVGAEASLVEPLGPLAPEARPNRWGEGTFRWEEEPRGASMAVVSFRPGQVHEGSAYPAVFAQRTDLGVTVRALRNGVIVWVTSIANGTPLEDVRITIANRDEEIVMGETDAHGVAWLRTPEAELTSQQFAVLAQTPDDRAAMVVDGSSSLGPARLGLAMSGDVPPNGVPRASVFTDRGVYRPGELVRLKTIVRNIERTAASAYGNAPVLLRVEPGSPIPIAERSLETNRFGSASTSVLLPTSSPLGHYQVVVLDPEGQSVLGQSSFRVANFREPTFRVDLDAPAEVLAGQAIQAKATGMYLFGAPVAEGDIRWSLVRESAASYPARWRDLTFGPVDGHVNHGTIEAGRGRLEDDGTLSLDLSGGLTASRRQRLVLEVEVQDRTGQTTAAHEEIVLAPAAIEVGLARGDEWVSLGEALTLEAVAIDLAGEPQVGTTIRGRVYREGWHRWYEWARGRSYQVRREQERELAHRCEFESTDEASGCSFTPERPGTYVLEVETRDENGRSSVASRRLYVAGPDEAPDRDPPGSRIALTPNRRAYTVGERAELAFESPWDNAEALITIEQEGFLRYDRRTVSAGGQVIPVDLDESMVPNVFVSVTLVRPRTAPPTEEVDLHGPDLRFGAAELRVTPEASRLEVAIDAPEESAPGREVQVEVQVDGADGPTEVALWVVDEGLLRMTDYATPNPIQGLWPRLSPRFSWDDLRRILVSRVVPPAHRAGGDGGGGGERILRPDERVIDPVALWEPHLMTDPSGHATARMRLPERTTEYRIIALAIDDEIAWGHAEAQLVATRPLVLADALPRFATKGDRFEAAFFVHGTSEGEQRVPVTVRVDGEVVHHEVVTLQGRAQQRIATEVVATGTSMDFVLQAGEASLTREVPITPRARWHRSMAVGAVSTEGSWGGGPQLRIPPSEGGEITLTVATHPFVGLAIVSESLDESPWGGLQHTASTVHALAAQVRLAEGVPSPRTDRSARAYRVRLARATDRLLALHSSRDGGFGRWASNGYSYGWENAFATHALVAAAEAGVDVSLDALTRALNFLERFVQDRSFADGSSWRQDDALAYALRVLSVAGKAQPERMADLFERRDQLTIAGLAHLAMAYDPDENRRATLVQEATRFALENHEENEALATYVRFWDRRASVLGPLLEAAASTNAGVAHAGPIASELLKLADSTHPFAWRSAFDAAYALRGLAEYAQAFISAADELPEVTLDGEPLRVTAQGEFAAAYVMNAHDVGGAHRQLEIIPAGERPIFYALEGVWTTPLSDVDRAARGARVALHRRFETASGRQLREGDTVALGEMIRVRLFVFSEGGNPPEVLLHDPLGGGFEAVQRQFATSAHGAIETMLGMGPDDDAVDPRGYHAMRSSHSIAHRALERNAAVFYFDGLPSGLQEYTYVVRATSTGEFVLPPAQIESATDNAFVGRSQMFSLRVTDGPDEEASAE